MDNITPTLVETELRAVASLALQAEIAKELEIEDPEEETAIAVLIGENS